MNLQLNSPATAPPQSVAIFTSAYHPSMGGVEEVVRQVSHAYQRQGLSVVLVTNRWPRTLPRFEMHEGIPVHRLAMRTPEFNLKVQANYWLHIWQTRRRLFQIMREHNVALIHVHCASSNGFYAMMAARALTLPMVLTTHGERTMDTGTIYEVSKFQNRILRELVRDAAHVTACSMHTLRDLEEYYGEPLGDRSSVVYNGIEDSEFRTSEAHRTARPYIFAIGRLVPQKGFDILIEAFQRADLAGYDLLIAGDGPEEEFLARLIVERGLSDRVHLVGRKDRAAVTAMFKGCAFFVLPSRQEPLGIVNLEAMAAGKAVIASRTGGVPEIVLENETGLLVPPGDIAALTQAIRKLGADLALRESLGAAGRLRIESFTWDAAAKAYRDIYDKVMAGLGKRLPAVAGGAPLEFLQN